MKIDADVQQGIKQMNYLAQVHSIELKSLLITKLSEMNIKKIPFNLEVINPVTHINMKLMDYIRCTGILIDNAIEETQKQAHGQIILVFLQESNSLTMLVKTHCKVKWICKKSINMVIQQRAACPSAFSQCLDLPASGTALLFPQASVQSSLQQE